MFAGRNCSKVRFSDAEAQIATTIFVDSHSVPVNKVLIN